MYLSGRSRSFGSSSSSPAVDGSRPLSSFPIGHGGLLEPPRVSGAQNRHRLCQDRAARGCTCVRVSLGVWAVPMLAGVLGLPWTNCDAVRNASSQGPRNPSRGLFLDFFWAKQTGLGRLAVRCAGSLRQAFIPTRGLELPVVHAAFIFIVWMDPPSSWTPGGNFAASGFQTVCLYCRIVPGAVLSLTLTLRLHRLFFF